MEIAHGGHKGGTVLTAQLIAQLSNIANDFHALGV
jgi:hypothetical protein